MEGYVVWVGKDGRVCSVGGGGGGGWGGTSERICNHGGVKWKGMSLGGDRCRT